MPAIVSCLALALMSMLCGGCITGSTVYFATHEDTRYLHDQVKHIEKAAVTPDSRLVLWVDGKMADADHPGKYTVTASLLAPASRAAFAEKDHASVRRSAIIDGWEGELMQSAGLAPVAVAPLVVLPGHQMTYTQRDRFTGIAGARRSVYVVRNAADDLNLKIVYVEPGRVPEKTFFSLETKNVRVPHRYYLFLWLPVTIPADAATLPIQILLWPLMASITC